MLGERRCGCRGELLRPGDAQVAVERPDDHVPALEPHVGADASFQHGLGEVHVLPRAKRAEVPLIRSALVEEIVHARPPRRISRQRAGSFPAQGLQGECRVGPEKRDAAARAAGRDSRLR